MPTFEIQGANGETYEVEAPDHEIAMQAYRNYVTNDGSYAMPGSPQDGYGVQTMSGVNEGLGNTLGAPVDAVNWAIGLGMEGINKLAGTDFQASAKPFLGSEQINGWMGDAGAIVPPSTDAGKQVARRVGQEVGAVVIPGFGMAGAGGRLATKGAQKARSVLGDAARTAARNPGKFAAVEAGLATTSGLGAAVGQQLAPGNAVAEVAGQLVGGLSPLAFAGASRKLRGPKSQRVEPTSMDDLVRKKNEAYEEVDRQGVRYRPEAMDELVGALAEEMRAGGIHPLRHPKANSMLGDLQKMAGTEPTLGALDKTRQAVSRDVARALDPSEAHFGRKMIDNFDEFIGSAGPGQVSAGNAERGSVAISRARDLGSRVFRAERVESALERAVRRANSTGSGGNVNNAIRQNIRGILDSPKKSRGFTAQERELMESIVAGSKGENALRGVGKLSPSGNGLMTALGIGGTAANPLLAGFPIVGAVAKSVADKATMGKVDELTAMIRNGPPPKPQKAPALNPVDKSALVALLLGNSTVDRGAPLPSGR